MGTKRAYLTDPLGSATVVEVASSSLAPPLKLRIKHQTLTQKLTIDIYEAKNTKDKLKNLLRFARQLRLHEISTDECEQLIRLFKELIKKESDHMVRVKSVELLSEICRVPGANKLQIVEEILDSLHKESKSYIYNIYLIVS